VRAASTLFCFAACIVHAGDICPAPPKFTSTRPANIAADDHRIFIDSNDGIFGTDGAVLTGRVNIRQDERSVAADSVAYDYLTDKVTVKGKVDFLDPRLRVQSDSGSYETLGGASFNEAFFQLMNRSGRGFAKDVEVTPEGKVALGQVQYTTCPV